MEDVECAFAGADLEREGVARLGIGDGDEHAVVVRAPEQPHVDAVADTVIELAQSGCGVLGHATTVARRAPSRTPRQPASEGVLTAVAGVWQSVCSRPGGGQVNDGRARVVGPGDGKQGPWAASACA